MHLFNYILGNLIIMRYMFNISYNITDHIIQKYQLNPLKFDRFFECIYSSFHAGISTMLCSISIKRPLFAINEIWDYGSSINVYDNQLQYFISSFSFSYFLIDLLYCLYRKKYVFVLHHVAALNLLLITFMNFYNHANKGVYTVYYLFLLESNTILLNIGYLLKELQLHYSITCTSWIIHLLLFSLFRLIMIPRLTLIYYMNEGFNGASIFEIPNLILIMSGSTYWAYRQTKGIHKLLKENNIIN